MTHALSITVIIFQVIFCQECILAWELVFRGASGRLGGQNNIHALWVSQNVSNTNNVQARTIGSGSSLHYKSEIVERWDDYHVDKIKLSVHKNGTEQVFFIFNGTKADKTSWMSPARLMTSSYNGLKTSTFNSFSVDGLQNTRRFFINNGYGGCGNDRGWIVVAEGTTCPWESRNQNPNILYSPNKNKYTNWLLSGEPADEMTISFDARERCIGGCLNGGTCLPNDICLCVPGWGGKKCQNAMCVGNCSNHGDCIGPNLCRCHGQFHGTRCQFNTDPCLHNNFKEINDPSRSVKNMTTLARDDKTLIEGWYRFISPSGEKMPQSCDKTFINKCGTSFPIWLQGSYPKQQNGIVNLKGCVSTGINCCSNSYQVRVKQCSTFLLYYLQPTSKTSLSGYCAGSEIPCPQGQSSKTGYTPGCTSNAPILGHKPVLSIVHNPKHNDLYFKCNIPVKKNDKLALLVDWYADNERIKHEQIDFTPYTAILDWRHLKGHAGKTITCRVRGKYSGNTIISPQVVSNGHFVGVEVKTPSVVVKEGGSMTYVEAKLTTPFVCEDIKPKNSWGFTNYFGGQSSKKCDCKLVLKMGVPKYQDHAPPRCSDGKEIEQVVFSQQGKEPCAIEITPDNWNKTFKIPLKAKLDMKYDGNRYRQIEILPVSSCKQTIYTNYKPPSIQVTATDSDKSGFCASVNDPHFTTFDGFHYNHYYEGEFVLYRHKTLPYEVRVFYVRCNGHAACNCALAVRSGDDVIVVDYCSKKKSVNVWGQFKTITNTPLRIKGYVNGQLTLGTGIFSKNDGRQFEVRLPTGTVVKISVEKYGFGTFLNAFIQASPVDRGFTEGLCGTFNGIQKDDLTLPTGIVYTGPGHGGGQQPHGFSTAWRVDDKNSYCNGLPAGASLPKSIPIVTQTSPKNPFCECSLDPFGTNKTVHASCASDKDISSCTVQTGSLKDITGQVLGNVKHRRHRRDTSFSTDIFEEEASSTKFKYDKNFVQKSLSFPTPSGTTHTAAISMCMEMFANKTYTQHCEQLVSSVSVKTGTPMSLLGSAVDMCVQDILLSDSNIWGQSTVQAFQEHCLTEVHRYISSWDYKNGTSVKLPPAFTEQICFNDCSGNGKCVASVCQCHKGFIGTDCSVDFNKAPDVIYLPHGGLCDTAKFKCHTVIVYGDNFVDSPSLSCHQQETLVHDNGYNYTSAITKSKATFRHFGEVACRLNFRRRYKRSIPHSQTVPVGSANGIVISVSNNGKTPGSKLMVIVFDSRCQSCSAVGTCSLINNTCLINTRCYGSGDLNPVDSCRHCMPNISVDRWFYKDGCKHRIVLLWIVIILCVALFLSIMITIVFFICNIKSKSPTVASDPVINLQIKTPKEAW